MEKIVPVVMVYVQSMLNSLHVNPGETGGEQVPVKFTVERGHQYRWLPEVLLVLLSFCIYDVVT